MWMVCHGVGGNGDICMYSVSGLVFGPFAWQTFNCRHTNPCIHAQASSYTWKGVWLCDTTAIRGPFFLRIVLRILIITSSGIQTHDHWSTSQLYIIIHPNYPCLVDPQGTRSFHTVVALLSLFLGDLHDAIHRICQCEFLLEWDHWCHWWSCISSWFLLIEKLQFNNIHVWHVRIIFQLGPFFLFGSILHVSEVSCSWSPVWSLPATLL